MTASPHPSRCPKCGCWPIEHSMNGICPITNVASPAPCPTCGHANHSLAPGCCGHRHDENNTAVVCGCMTRSPDPSPPPERNPPRAIDIHCGFEICSFCREWIDNKIKEIEKLKAEIRKHNMTAPDECYPLDI